jgi:hypothetical protein
VRAGCLAKPVRAVALNASSRRVDECHVKRHMALQHYMCDEREEGGAFRGALARDVLFFVVFVVFT